MSNEILSHYSYNQFLLVLTLLISFSGSTIFSFLTLSYCQSKRNVLLIWAPYILLQFMAVQIETSFQTEHAVVYIFSFRALSSMLTLSLIYIGIQQKRKVFLFYILWMAVILLLSFATHYLPMYLCALFLPIAVIISKPSDFEILVKKHSNEILYSLDEAILILSPSKEILFVNPRMLQLLEYSGDTPPGFQDIDKALFLNNSEIQNILMTQVSSQIVKSYRDSSLLINYTNVKNKGLIVTATDISESIRIQKEIRKNIDELDTLNNQLIRYSEKNESLQIQEEKNELIRYIQTLIQNQMGKLQEQLESIKDKPPENYAHLLESCRSVLDEIRLVVTNWRLIQGETK